MSVGIFVQSVLAEEPQPRLMIAHRHTVAEYERLRVARITSGCA